MDQVSADFSCVIPVHCDHYCTINIPSNVKIRIYYLQMVISPLKYLCLTAYFIGLEIHRLYE